MRVLAVLFVFLYALLLLVLLKLIASLSQPSIHNRMTYFRIIYIPFRLFAITMVMVMRYIWHIVYIYVCLLYRMRYIQVLVAAVFIVL